MRAARGSRRALRAKADRLFSLYIRQRDGHCLVCAKDFDLQCAHIVTRGEHAIRFDPHNAVTLCRGHHLYFTTHPFRWQVFIQEEFAGRYEELWAKIQLAPKLDYVGIIDWLEAQRLGGGAA